MKKILIAGLISFLISISYVFLVVAPIVRIPFSASFKIVADIVSAPGFNFFLIIPFATIYSMIRVQDYKHLNTIRNVSIQFMVYVVFNFGFFFIFGNGFKTTTKDSINTLIAMLVGILLFFIFHVLFMTYILKRPWIKKFLLTKK